MFLVIGAVPALPVAGELGRALPRAGPGDARGAERPRSRALCGVRRAASQNLKVTQNEGPLQRFPYFRLWNRGTVVIWPYLCLKDGPRQASGVVTRLWPLFRT